VVRHYRNIGPQALPYTNKGTDWLIIIGAQFVNAGTIGANSNVYFLRVTDGQGTTADEILLNGSNYVAAPTTAGTIVYVALVKIMRIPPGGTVTSPGGIALGIQLIEALDTYDQDGRDSLENALLVST
jgi:hypothetical protein